MNKRGTKTYKADCYYEQLVIGDRAAREWLKTKQYNHNKRYRRSTLKANMKRRWRRKLKQNICHGTNIKDFESIGDK